MRNSFKESGAVLAKTTSAFAEPLLFFDGIAMIPQISSFSFSTVKSRLALSRRTSFAFPFVLNRERSYKHTKPLFFLQTLHKTLLSSFLK